MSQTRRSAQRGEIVQAGSSRDIVEGPATRWMAPVEQNIAFPIERLAGNDAGLVGGALAQLDPAILGAVGGSEGNTHGGGGYRST